MGRFSKGCRQIDLDALPTSDALRALQPQDEARWPLQLAGGDDYELCFTAPASEAFAIELARRGFVVVAMDQPGQTKQRASPCS